MEVGIGQGQRTTFTFICLTQGGCLFGGFGGPFQSHSLMLPNQRVAYSRTDAFHLDDVSSSKPLMFKLWIWDLKWKIMLKEPNWKLDFTRNFKTLLLKMLPFHLQLRSDCFHQCLNKNSKDCLQIFIIFSHHVQTNVLE